MNEKTQKLKRKSDFKYSDYVVLLALVGICLILAILKPVFISYNNIMNVLLQTATNSIVAIGMTIVILTGGIDLSVGSIVGASGIVMGIVYQAFGFVDSPIAAIVCILAGLTVGMIFGFINGILISKAKLPAFIATLGTMSIARGVALALTNSRPVTKVSEIIRFIGNGKLAGIYFPIILMILLYVLAWWFLRYTKTGRSIYASGGNRESARLSGINVNMITVTTYTISGVLAALASVVLVGRLATCQPTSGEGYEMDAIAATVIGGASMTGGEGRIIGTLIGALIISVIKNGLNLLNVSTYIQQIVTGAVIIFAVMTDTLKSTKK